MRTGPQLTTHRFARHCLWGERWEPTASSPITTGHAYCVTEQGQGFCVFEEREGGEEEERDCKAGIFKSSMLSVGDCFRTKREGWQWPGF